MAACEEAHHVEASEVRAEEQRALALPCQLEETSRAVMREAHLLEGPAPHDHPVVEDERELVEVAQDAAQPGPRRAERGAPLGRRGDALEVAPRGAARGAPAQREEGARERGDPERRAPRHVAEDPAHRLEAPRAPDLLDLLPARGAAHRATPSGLERAARPASARGSLASMPASARAYTAERRALSRTASKWERPPCR